MVEGLPWGVGDQSLFDFSLPIPPTSAPVTRVVRSTMALIQSPPRSRVAPMARIRNVFEIIELYGHDENFEPQSTAEFVPTSAPAGSRQKLDILAERIQRGMPLWHPEDSTDTAAGVLVGAGDER
jgi:hypothetical protein